MTIAVNKRHADAETPTVAAAARLPTAPTPPGGTRSYEDKIATNFKHNKFCSC